MPFTAINLTRGLTNLFKVVQLVSREPEFEFSFISEPLYILNPCLTVPPANISICYIFSHTFFYLILIATW